jgi:hypothetical protein
MSKLHLSKPLDDKDAVNPETKDTDKPAAK